MDMKTLKYIYMVTILAMVAACSSMDDKYKDFVDDGPINYLTKITDITVIGERNRVQFILPKSDDLRGKTAVIYWSNRSCSHEEAINPAEESRFYINDLAEGTYIFEIILKDDEGNSSLPISITGVVYGDIYEQYLSNRVILSRRIVNGNTELTFAEVTDTTMLRTEIEWSRNGQVQGPFIIDTSPVHLIEGLDAGSFKYRSFYKPGTADEFHSSYTFDLLTPTADDIAYDRLTKTFTFPDLSADDNWVGYELKWIDRFTIQQKSAIITGENEFAIADYQSAEITYTTLYRINDATVASAALRKETAGRGDLDRSLWYIAPETRKDNGAPILNVLDGEWTSAAASVAGRNKSDYFSHLLPWAAGYINSPTVFMDGDVNTYLSMIKGRGTTIINEDGLSEGANHSWGGVTSDGNEVYFMIELGPTPQEIDYLRIDWLPIGNGTGKPGSVSLYGSNDDDCVTDPSKWIVIQLNLVLPGWDAAGGNTGNVQIPLSNYKYFKFRYNSWTSSGQSLQISEFYLGGTVY
jgi:hypothetical protein